MGGSEERYPQRDRYGQSPREWDWGEGETKKAQGKLNSINVYCWVRAETLDRLARQSSTYQRAQRAI